MADFGTDIGGVEDIDANLSTVSGNRVVAENFARELLTPPGSLFYNKDYGAGISGAINGSVVNTTMIQNLAEKAAFRDERIEDAEIVVTYIEATQTLDIRALITTADGPFDLTIIISNVISDGSNQPAVQLFLEALPS